MNNSELFNIIHSRIFGVQEIPVSELNVVLPGENRSFRDPWLFIRCPKEQWLACAKILKEDERLSFDFMLMLTAVDVLGNSAGGDPRMELVCLLHSFRYGHRLTVKVSLTREDASVDSVAGVWQAADWQEREVYDMFGIRFEGHPNLTRILMWEGFPGFPLKKDYVHVPDRYDD